MSIERVHIVKRASGWAVRKEKNKKASKIYPTKEGATKGAEKLLEEGNDLIIHNGDGSIQDWRKSKR
jgi:hypothetical protein